MEIAKDYSVHKKWTSQILNFVRNHKFIVSVVSMFISFSLLNMFLLWNFISLLEKTNLY